MRLSPSDGNRSSRVVAAWFSPGVCDAVFFLLLVILFFTGKSFFIAISFFGSAVDFLSVVFFFIVIKVIVLEAPVRTARAVTEHFK